MRDAVTYAGAALAAVLMAVACQLVAVHDTPVDRALPLIALGVTAVAAVSYSSVMIAVPLLMLAETAVADETARLVAIGAIVAAVFAIAVVSQRKGVAPLVTAVAAVVLLRWIPLESVLLFREVFLLLTVTAIVLVLGRTPFAVALAVTVALVTPAIPLRTLALPLVVLAALTMARFVGMPALRLAWPSAIVIGFVMLFFSWSGVVARALPYFLRVSAPERERAIVARALPANETLTLEVPDDAQALIMSGANTAELRRGAPLGRIDPGGRIVRVGDAADWGYMRRAEFYGSHNPLPRDSAGRMRDHGYAAWVDGAGRVPLPPGARTIRITAEPSLPPGASLQVEAFEIGSR